MKNKREVKSIDSLMKYLRDVHHIAIKGSVQKRKLRNIGYYHGYKGYRYIGEPKNRINYNDFNQIIAVNDFDMKLKALFYPQIMFIETALRNYVLEVIIDEGQRKGFNDIYNNLLTDYKTHKFNSGDFKEAIRKRLDLRNRIYNVLTQNYKNNKQLARHFYHKDLPVPIWAIFEMLCLGEFGTFVACLNLECRKKISQSLGLNQSCDTEAKLTKTIIFTIKDLRNAIAHNDVIFDARFKEGKVGNQLLKCLEYDTKVTNITFETIVDYLVLVVYLLKKFQVPFTELRRLILNFQGILETLRKQIPISVYSRIIYTDTRNKPSVLKEFI